MTCSARKRLRRFAVALLFLAYGCFESSEEESPEEEKENEDAPFSPPAATDDYRYDTPESPGSSLEDPPGHCLVMGGYDKERKQLFFADPGDNLRAGHQRKALYSPFPVRIQKNYLTTEIAGQGATVSGAIIVIPPAGKDSAVPSKWKQFDLPDLSQHASPAWENFCAPTSAANLMIGFSSSFPRLHPKRLFTESPLDDEEDYLNRLIAGYREPLPKARSLAAFMGTTTRQGTTGKGILTGTKQFLDFALGSDARRWKVVPLMEDMDAPDGPELFEELCRHCASGHGIMLLVLWALPDAGGGDGGGLASSSPDSAEPSGGREESSRGGGTGRHESSGGSGGTALPEGHFPEGDLPTRSPEPEDLRAVVVDDFNLEERSGLWYEKGKSQPFTGKGRRSYPSGAKLMEMAYKDGKRHGTQTVWREDGSIIRKAEWRNGNPVK